MTVSLRTFTCFHEAAHAVVGIGSGLEVEFTCVRSPINRQAEQGHGATMFTTKLADDAGWDESAERVVNLYAGRVAEEHLAQLAGVPLPPMRSDNSDNEQAAAILTRFKRLADADEMRERTRAEVRSRWKAINAVSRSLESLLSLTGPEVERLIEDSGKEGTR